MILTGSLTDLHTHILPHMDDGAKDLEMAQKMLWRQKEIGVERVMLTPHFYVSQEEPASFLQRRQRSFESLMSIWDKDSMPEVKLGAEVRYFPEVGELDLEKFTLGGGRYLLLELSYTSAPVRLLQAVDRLINQGVTPIIAHVERHSYFRNAPQRLLELAERGALAQVSVQAVEKEKQKFAKLCLKYSLAQTVASDAHNLEDRAPCLGTGLQKQAEQTERFARRIWDNREVPPFTVREMKKGLFGYF